MNFVKTSIFQQEFTEQGINEIERSAKSKEEVEAEQRLAKLPEFNRDPQFRSLAEQLHENSESAPAKESSSEAPQPQYALASVTEDEYEFYESLHKRESDRRVRQLKEDAEIRKEFAEAKQSLTSTVSRVSPQSPSTEGGSAPSRSPAVYVTEDVRSPTSFFDAIKQTHEKQAKRQKEYQQRKVMAVKKRSSAVVDATTIEDAKKAKSEELTTGITNSIGLSDLFGGYMDDEGDV